MIYMYINMYIYIYVHVYTYIYRYSIQIYAFFIGSHSYGVGFLLHVWVQFEDSRRVTVYSVPCTCAIELRFVDIRILGHIKAGTILLLSTRYS